jgi:hypothetical protein
MFNMMRVGLRRSSKNLVDQILNGLRMKANEENFGKHAMMLIGPTSIFTRARELLALIWLFRYRSWLKLSKLATQY